MPDTTDLINQIEAQTNTDLEPNTSLLVRLYREHTTEKPIMKLLQDIQQRANIYYNILEEIKQMTQMTTPASPTSVLDDQATLIKRKYEILGLIATGTLPNPTALNICNAILNKLRKFAGALTDILARYASEIAAELHINSEITVTFEVGIGWPPNLTIGVERSGSLNTSIAALPHNPRIPAA